MAALSDLLGKFPAGSPRRQARRALRQGNIGFFDPEDRALAGQLFQQEFASTDRGTGGGSPLAISFRQDLLDNLGQLGPNADSRLRRILGIEDDNTLKPGMFNLFADRFGVAEGTGADQIDSLNFSVGLQDIGTLAGSDLVRGPTRSRFLQNILSPPTPDPVGTGGTGGGGGGGAVAGGSGAGTNLGTGGGQGGLGLPGVPNVPNVGPGNTPADPFPTQTPLDPNNFDPTQGAPPGVGIDFGASPFSQMIEGGLAGVIQGGGAPLSPFAQQTRQALGSNLASLAADAGQGVASGPQPRQFQQSEFDPASFNLPEAQTGLTDLGQKVAGSVGGIIERGGSLGGDVVDRHLESVREALDRQRRAQTQRLGSQLAARGLGGTGSENTALGRTERDIASQFATAARDIFTQQQLRDADRLSQALGLGAGIDESLRSLGEQARQFDVGTGADLFRFQEGLGASELGRTQALGEQQRQFTEGLGADIFQFQEGLGLQDLARRDVLEAEESQFARGLGESRQGRIQDDINELLGTAVGLGAQDQQAFLSALGQGTGRQGVLSDIALQILQENRLFNQFSSQQGLNRELALEQLIDGDIQQVLSLIAPFFQSAGVTGRGAV